jgi:hypothetical protein
MAMAARRVAAKKNFILADYGKNCELGLMD